MNKICLMIASAALTFPAIAVAQNAAPASSTDERRLSPEQVEAVLADAASKRAAAQSRAPVDAAITDDDDLPTPPPQVHGEVGVAIGTGGYREAYGTAVYPLEDGVVAISLGFADFGRRRWR